MPQLLYTFSRQCKKKIKYWSEQKTVKTQIH